ncbi:DUF5954 family protein [Streptomyces sp. Marseille-Q5077]|uniref:DUF5954 family protein n=1 Tax=Streptomyces sp. Marseille-Q5077 TaxID=3418995 RepID=UPI003D03685E
MKQPRSRPNAPGSRAPTTPTPPTWASSSTRTPRTTARWRGALRAGLRDFAYRGVRFPADVRHDSERAMRTRGGRGVPGAGVCRRGAGGGTGVQICRAGRLIRVGLTDAGGRSRRTWTSATP